MNLIGFQEFSAQAPLLQLFNFFQIWTFFNVMTLILYQFFLWNWEICGWLREINKLFYKKQSFLFSNDHIIFMTKYGCLSYEHELTKVFYPLFKSFLPPSSMFFPTIIHIPSSKIQNGNMEENWFFQNSLLFFMNVQEWVKNFLKMGVKNFW